MSEWQPIETAPRGELILYFPATSDENGRNRLGPMMRIDHYPVYYPRKPTHWMPKPGDPE